MGADAKNRQIARDKHFGSDLLVLATLEIGTGVNRVLASPTGRAEESVQTVCVRPLIGIWNYLPT
jgi:hypothetical protein